MSCLNLNNDNQIIIMVSTTYSVFISVESAHVICLLSFFINWLVDGDGTGGRPSLIFVFHKLVSWCRWKCSISLDSFQTRSVKAPLQTELRSAAAFGQWQMKTKSADRTPSFSVSLLYSVPVMHGP